MSIGLVKQSFLQSARNFEKLAELAPLVADAAEIVIRCIRRGGKVMFCGNGGSAADAQHLAAELMGRYMIDRAPLPAMALSVNSSTVTAVSNDYSYDEVFERQVRGIGRAEDVLVCISTSGNSSNVLQALEAAKGMGMLTIGLTGEGGGKMAEMCDISIQVPSASTPRIQEMHIAVGHCICELVEAAMAS